MDQKPDFEKPNPDYEYSKGEEIYIIDKNKYDIWKAHIKKILSNGFSVHYELNGEDKKYPNAKRFLLPTDRNNEIFNQQEKLREESKQEEEKKKIAKTQKKKEKSPKPKTKTSPKSKKKESDDADDFEEDEEDIKVEIEDDDDDDDDDDDEDPSKEIDSNPLSQSQSTNKKKRKKTSTVKKPIMDNHSIAFNAWQNGIKDTDSFRSFMMENLETAVSDFERIYKMHNISEYPPFKLGGNIDAKSIELFWKQCQIIWKQLFGDLDFVPSKEFLKKATAFFKLPNQLEANARETLTFIFDPETYENVDFVQFCSFLAMFGPHETAIRKVGHWLKCPPEMKDALLFPDIPDTFAEIGDDTEMNCFTIKTGKEEDEESQGAAEKLVFNLPLIDTDGSYLVDGEGVVYKDWDEYFQKNNDVEK